MIIKLINLKTHDEYHIHHSIMYLYILFKKKCVKIRNTIDSMYHKSSMVVCIMNIQREVITVGMSYDRNKKIREKENNFFFVNLDFFSLFLSIKKGRKI